ncbi:hypothetical protein, partial [Helicobacter bilis]|uniref:hypothetical protein n=1 Tax=Helicobacter bilis TaxID=37372 RepID=UPI001F42C394
MKWYECLNMEYLYQKVLYHAILILFLILLLCRILKVELIYNTINNHIIFIIKNQCYIFCILCLHGQQTSKKLALHTLL